MSISSIPGTVPVSGPVEPAGYSSITPEHRHLIQAVKAIDPAPLFGEDTKLTFVWDRATRRMLVRIVNRKTGDPVIQVPPEYVIHLVEENKRK